MRIGELAGILDVSTKTLRHYERIGLLPHASRDANGYRQYSPAAVSMAKRIVALRGLDLSLNTIGDLLQSGPSETLRKRLVSVLDQQRQHMSLEISVLQGKNEDLEARFLSLIQTDQSKPGSCICGLLNEACNCKGG